jgi:hypothetical protein
MNDVMIDIETPGTKPGSAILTIGAVKFDRDGTVGDKFYARIGAQALMYGTSSVDTLKWWKTQPQAAYDEAWNGTENPFEVAQRFTAWLKQNSKNIIPWGNGSVFDMVLLEAWFDKMGVVCPWKFWDIRDVRTVADLSGIGPKSIIREGVHHNALDDSLHQIKYLCAGFKKLGVV